MNYANLKENNLMKRLEDVIKASSEGVGTVLDR